jgi:uncharacterized protein YraI
MPAPISARARLLAASVFTFCFLLITACGSAPNASSPYPTKAAVTAAAEAEPTAGGETMQALGSVSSAEATVEPAAELPPQARVAADANVRSGPNVAFERIGGLSIDTMVNLVSVFERDGERWYEVEADGLQGWMSNTVLAFEPGVAERVAVNTTSWNIPQPTTVPIAAPEAPAAPAFAAPRGGFDANGDGKVTCKDFYSQAEAQAAYESGYSRLDGNDKDGFACESLP